MILKYGTFAHANNEVSFSIDRAVSKRDAAGRVEEETERWVISGYLQAASQSALTTAINAIKAAYAVDGLDLIFYLDNGTTQTAHSMKASEALSGPFITQRPSFPEGRGAEYSTFRSYSITAEATFIGDPNIDLTDFQESIQFTGGGERWAYKETLVGPPQRQPMVRQTTYRVTQRGSAVGKLNYPAIPGPLWPAQEHVNERTLNRVAPMRKGNTLESWRVEWSYSFESPTPLVGNPSLWRHG